VKVFDAEGHILGRLAAIIAKDLLNGEEVRVVNATEAIITGKKKMVMAKYRKMRELVHPRKGPFYPRRADRLFKRTVRGMLPIKKPRGREAYSRLKVYLGVPPELENNKKIRIKASMKITTSNCIKLGEVSRHLGVED